MDIILFANVYVRACVRVCVCACVRVRVYACVCACVRTCARAQFVRFKLKDPIVNWIALNASRCHGLRKK